MQHMSFKIHGSYGIMVKTGCNNCDISDSFINKYLWVIKTIV